ncbi:sugar ABC transporter ATP-binding protein [Domibacillus indicus]|uniref:sugar ABC transporter ATP-binding protein n=1 Tax=Domibacillus indicus TaxID=1437523 RepID=UPI0020410D37|nr:sugar ABC transporter ATP-binding protein [Domibacillus indicus]MCM3791339.1 sugar ABC transporter ATP-binding protein [Domibacillus indicus]
MKELLRLKDVCKGFSGIPVLKNINLDVRAGEVHVLLGENGAGKSTIIKIMTGAYSKDEGKLFWEGQKVNINTPSDAMDLGIATIYQELNLVPELPVYENIFLGRELKVKGRFSFLNKKEMINRSKEILKRLGQNIDPEALVSTLGIGQQQLVEIAKALTIDTKLIILDEPTSSLSASEAEQLLETIMELKRQGIAIVYISHRLEELKQIGDRITILRDGKAVATRQVSETSTDTMIELMVGRALEDKFPKGNFQLGSPGLKIENLKLKGSDKPINFTAYQGQILGIAGLVGAGRTELIRGIFGADPIDAGKVHVFGKKVKIKSPKDAINAGMAFITEDRKGEGLILDQSLHFNMSLASLKKFKKGLFIQNGEVNKKSDVYVNELQIRPNDIQKHARKLSGGNQQKVVIAKWLSTEARVFFFDEPTRGIDVGAKTEVYRLINSLVADGAIVVIVSSELPEILGVCNRILVMCEGEITADLLKEEASQELIMKAATGKLTEEDLCEGEQPASLEKTGVGGK